MDCEWIAKNRLTHVKNTMGALEVRRYSGKLNHKVKTTGINEMENRNKNVF
jgi:hypothetical protein